MTASPTSVPMIRRAVPADAPALARVAEATFVETFGHLYPPEDLQQYVSRTYTPENCRRTLLDPTMGVWLAQMNDPEPVGFIVAGRCKLPVEHLEPMAGEVHQLYVFARFHNLRIGSRLMDTALDWLASEGRSPVYVGVWSGNYGAQRFYARYGFSKCGEYDFPVGRTIDREFIMKR
ncbi:MAG: GNAT family N-acetyltransferase [Steroidobacteraceae bacterium]|nr:GNAT family N-acetyltransferase [Steroidobacteraceae bacterium]